MSQTGKICIIEEPQNKKCDPETFFPSTSTSSYGLSSLLGKKSLAKSLEDAKEKYEILKQIKKIKGVEGDNIKAVFENGEYHIRPASTLLMSKDMIESEYTKIISNLLFLTINLIYAVGKEDNSDESSKKSLLDSVVPGGSLAEYTKGETFQTYFVKCVEKLSKYLLDFKNIKSTTDPAGEELNEISSYFEPQTALNLFETYDGKQLTDDSIEYDVLAEYINNNVGKTAEDIKKYYEKHEQKIVTHTFEFLQLLLKYNTNSSGGNSRTRKTKRKVTRQSKKRRMNKKKSLKKKRKTRKHIKLQ